MNQIVEDLRKNHVAMNRDVSVYSVAADEIERLEAIVAQYPLTADTWRNDWGGGMSDMSHDMSAQTDAYRQRIIATCEQAIEFHASDDGFIVWWPAVNRGYLTSDDLRIIADELDARNAEWQRTIEQELGP
jgi:hypothetical protein